MLVLKGQLVGNDRLLKCTQANSGLLRFKVIPVPISDSVVGGKKGAAGIGILKKENKEQNTNIKKHSSCEKLDIRKLEQTQTKFLQVPFDLERAGFFFLPS